MIPPPPWIKAKEVVMDIEEATNENNLHGYTNYTSC